jgi:mRNA interferase HicA
VRRKDLLKRLRAIAKIQNETLIVTPGAKHDLARIGTRTQAIPRHVEINEYTAKKIIEEMERS